MIGSNMAIGASVMHVFLWYGKDILAVINKYRVGTLSHLYHEWLKVPPSMEKRMIPTTKR